MTGPKVNLRRRSFAQDDRLCRRAPQGHDLFDYLAGTSHNRAFSAFAGSWRFGQEKDVLAYGACSVSTDVRRVPMCGVG